MIAYSAYAIRARGHFGYIFGCCSASIASRQVDSPKVVHVGESWPCDQQIIEGGKKTVSIVVL